MTGTQKQVEWAEQIINDAIGTIDKNITLTKECIEKHGMKDEQTRLDAWVAAKNQYENVILKMPEAQNASWIIENKKGFDAMTIINRVDAIVASEKRK